MDDASKDNYFLFLTFDDLFMPAWAFGAALGYCNLVRHSIQKFDTNVSGFLITCVTENGCNEREGRLPGLMLYWAIKTNQPELVICFVMECGFQFRWISLDLEPIFGLLFHIDRTSDEFGVWRSRDYNPDEDWFARQIQRTYRARCCYSRSKRCLHNH